MKKNIYFLKKKGILLLSFCLLFLFSSVACQNKASEKLDKHYIFKDFKKDKSITETKGYIKKYKHKERYYYGVDVRVKNSIDAFECYIVTETISENMKVDTGKKVEFLSGDISSPLTSKQLSEFRHKHMIAGYDNHYFIKNIKWKK